MDILHIPIKRYELVAIATFLLCLFGCAATGPTYERPSALESSASEIVIYRPDRFARGGNTFYVHLDGKEVAKLQNAGFAIIPTSPGSHELEIRGPAMDFAFKPIKMTVSTSAGGRLFVRFEPYMSGGIVATPFATVIPVAYRFALVPEADALIDLKTLRRSE